MEIRALLFDFDDTIAQTAVADSVLLTCKDIAELRHDLDQSHLVAANGSVWREYWPQVEEAWTLGELDGRSVGVEAWRRTLQRCECDDQMLAEWAQERHWFHRQQTIRLFDDAQTLLNVVTGRLPLGLVTSGASDTQRHALRSLGVEELFSVVYISGERRVAKPAPEVFLTALEELGVSPEHALHVGDNLVTDVAGAKGAGLTAVWLNRPGRPPHNEGVLPDHEIRSLADLTALLPS